MVYALVLLSSHEHGITRCFGVNLKSEDSEESGVGTLIWGLLNIERGER